MMIVDLIPGNMRPYVGGSPTNSVIELTFAYNGIDRIISKGQMPEAMQVPAKFNPVESDAGLLRLFNANYNQESSWLLIVALFAVGIMAASWRKLQDDGPRRPLVLLSGIWLITAFLLLSFMGDQIHTYYTAALGPPLALVLGLAADALIGNRHRVLVRVGGGIGALLGILTSWLILGGTAEWPGWLPTSVLGAGIAAIAALVVRPPSLKIERAAAGLLVASLLCGPAITSVHNVTVTFNGSNPLSGVLSRNPASISHLMASLRNNELPWGHDIAFGREPDGAVLEALRSTSCKWAAATYASQTAARLQLESGHAVMPLGGFAGSDPSPTPEEFKKTVAAGDICYFVQQEAFLEVQAAESASTAISRWVQENFASTKLGGTTVYKLTGH
jgi:4-amino-4-deoxy-L-arabinose transferase-like glycosyltransferase